MSEMIERVAMAIHAKEMSAFIWEHSPYPVREHRLSQARAAIEAMREPTAAMWEACGKAQADFETGIGWRVMIDAALK